MDGGVISIFAPQPPASRPAASAMRIEERPVDPKLRPRLDLLLQEPKVPQQVDRVLQEVNFDAATILVVMDSLGNQSKVKINADWPALKEAGIGSDAAVTLHIRNAKLSKVLELICNELGEGTVDYAFHDGAIILSTRSEFAKNAAKLQAQLDALVSISASSTPLSDVVDKLRRSSGADIFVNWKALERVGVRRSDPLTLQLQNVKLSKAITVMLNRIGNGDLRLDYTVDDGVISISTQSELAKNTFTRVYDVRDIVGNGKAEDRQARVNSLVSSIIDTIDSLSWRDNGGNAGSLRELQGQLIITQTPENQRKVIDLLAKYREEHRDQLAPTTRPNLSKD